MINNNPDIRNLGPSAIYHATFITSVSATGGRIKAFQLVPLGGAINGCDLATDKRRVECDITKWPEGVAKSFPSGADVDLHLTGGNSSVTVNFSISSNTLDPNTDNNFRSMKVHLCRTGDTNPSCSFPPPP